MAEKRTTPYAMDEPLDPSKVKPTPTQEENDRAMMGEHVMDKAPDGSPEEPVPEVKKRQVTAGQPAGSYQTRQVPLAPKPQPPSS